MAKRNKHKDRVRTDPGVITIEPNSPNKWYTTPVTGKPYWIVRAMAPWGERLRKRPKLWEAAVALRRLWEEKFKTWNEKHKDQTVPQVVVVNGNLNPIRIAEAQRALALLPKDEHDRPDPNAKLDEAIELALKHGWPGCRLKIKNVVAEVLKRSEYRVGLKWQETDSLSPVTLKGHKKDAKVCIKLFGEEQVLEINSETRQKQLLQEWELNHGKIAPHTKAGALKFLSICLHYLKEKELLNNVRVMSHQIKRTSMPRAMNILEQQNYLDTLYNSSMAACGYARFYLGLRPWSETKESELEEEQEYGLSPDLKTFWVPMDSKTGFRPVPCPPVATLVFKELLAEGRLYKRIHKKGFYILHQGSLSGWTHVYGRAGYHVGPCIMARALGLLASDAAVLGEKEIINRYRAKYPLKIWSTTHEQPTVKLVLKYVDDYWDIDSYYIQDYVRHGEISAYVNVTDGAIDQAKTRYGNSRAIINIHYRDYMSLADSILHYQLIPTALKGKYRAEDIPLPPWCKFSFVSLDADVLKEIQDKRQLLPKFDPDKKYGRKTRLLEWKQMPQEAREHRLRGLRAFQAQRIAKRQEQEKKDLKNKSKRTT